MAEEVHVLKLLGGVSTRFMVSALMTCTCTKLHIYVYQTSSGLTCLLTQSHAIGVLRTLKMLVTKTKQEGDEVQPFSDSNLMIAGDSQARCRSR